MKHNLIRIMGELKHLNPKHNTLREGTPLESEDIVIENYSIEDLKEIYDSTHRNKCKAVLNKLYKEPY